MQVSIQAQEADRKIMKGVGEARANNQAALASSDNKEVVQTIADKVQTVLTQIPSNTTAPETLNREVRDVLKGQKQNAPTKTLSQRSLQHDTTQQREKAKKQASQPHETSTKKIHRTEGDILIADSPVKRPPNQQAAAQKMAPLSTPHIQVVQQTQPQNTENDKVNTVFDELGYLSEREIAIVESSFLKWNGNKKDSIPVISSVDFQTQKNELLPSTLSASLIQTPLYTQPVGLAPSAQPAETPMYAQPMGRVLTAQSVETPVYAQPMGLDDNQPLFPPSFQENTRVLLDLSSKLPPSTAANCEKTRKDEIEKKSTRKKTAKTGREQLTKNKTEQRERRKELSDSPEVPVSRRTEEYTEKPLMDDDTSSSVLRNKVKPKSSCCNLGCCAKVSLIALAILGMAFGALLTIFGAATANPAFVIGGFSVFAISTLAILLLFKRSLNRAAWHRAA
jgi:hypothetical protein